MYFEEMESDALNITESLDNLDNIRGEIAYALLHDVKCLKARARNYELLLKMLMIGLREDAMDPKIAAGMVYYHGRSALSSIYAQYVWKEISAMEITPGGRTIPAHENTSLIELKPYDEVVEHCRTIKAITEKYAKLYMTMWSSGTYERGYRHMREAYSVKGQKDMYDRIAQNMEIQLKKEYLGGN